ncbi:pentatricopeptide repeat-containing protein At1g66345, mitochondrial-like [Chenopodium quinoa]|uniref:pentatricopeptide repeat-containing protein At1g66345, mitochondrial-like n=1 Tax=Chenopodium quinoa TaxID=63459 RepID=UPI000B78EA8A|nr:pentatricopeptide repeat-containing protein At1g66345, mitochondrial-like [Chenopodium quinoa]
MVSVFRHKVLTTTNIFLSIGKPTKRLLSHQLVVDDPNHKVASSLCDSLRKGLNWDSLSRKYDSASLDDPIIEKVLLEFKEPIEAKRALNFFHWVAHNNKLGHGLKHYCITIHILACARLVNDARSLLESILLRNDEIEVNSSLRFHIVDMLLDTYKITNSCPFVFDLLVQSYSKLRMYNAAFDVCCYLDECGFSLSLVTFNTLLHVIQKSPDGSNLIWEVYGHMIQKRTNPNDATVRIMINALCKAGELQKYMDIVVRIHGKGCSPMVAVNTSLVLRMLGEGRIEKGLVLLKRLLQNKLLLDDVSYSLVVYARLRCGELSLAREVYEQMLSSGFLPNSFVYTLFIGGYCEEGMVEEALKLMDEMVNMDLKPYDDTYNYLIMACANIGALVDSYRFCEEMSEKGLLPGTTAFNEMVGKLCQSGNMKQANDMLTVLMEKGYLPDETTFLHLIDGYGSESNFQEVLKLYYEMEFRSLSPGLPIFTSLIKTLCKCRKLDKADKYLTIMKKQSLNPTMCIYESLISAHLENGNKERAHLLYKEMIQIKA